MIGRGSIGGHSLRWGIAITAWTELPGNGHGAFHGLVGLTNPEQEIDRLAVQVRVAMFGDPEPIMVINSDGDWDDDPSVTEDHLELYLNSNRFGDEDISALFREKRALFEADDSRPKRP